MWVKVVPSVGLVFAWRGRVVMGGSMRVEEVEAELMSCEEDRDCQ